MTYSEFRYLWNVREVEKDNASRLRDITNVMTVTYFYGQFLIV